jgi:peroxiredoxin
VLWDGSPYGQENPQRTNEKGEYKLFLPAGKYFVEVEMAGKKKQRTEIFEIEKPTPMTNNFGLNKIKGFWNFWAEVVPIKLDNSKEENSEGEGKELVGKNLPSFDLSVGEEIFSDVSILGKPTVLTFISTWEPQTADQLRETEKLATNNSGINVMAVSVQESVSKTNIFKKVGGYDVKIMADPDGVLVEPLGLESLPRHLFLDRKGVIKETVLGFMTEKEMWQKVLE